ncbi:MAG: hypothetical protein J0L91_11630, partial [Burkholderiales bacterium]|nr:hypothetical protein [Burkholderiales bacterium]
MAQLSDDCFAFGGPLRRLDDALDALAVRLAAVTPREEVMLADATGRILAEGIHAGFPIPGFANSAVDGFAVCLADLNPAQETTLPVRGRIPAGMRDVPA